MDESIKGKTVKGVLWSSIERFSVQGISFLVMIVIARILSPKEYGLIAMLAIFIAVSQSLVNSGFSQALIRKQNRTDVDNCTVFYFNVIISLFLYAILYLISPLVASFYEEPVLCDVMRVFSLSIVINSFSVVQRAIYTAELDFKTQAKASFIAAVISGILGIYMAYAGFGVWALVYQQLSNFAINTIFLWIYAKWWPKMIYSWQSFRELFAFGSKLMVSGLLDTIYNNAYQLVIGKVFNASSLGFYSRASHFSDFPSSNITNIIQRVTYPVLCTMQDDDEKLSKVYRKFLKLSAFVIFPLMCLMAGVAHPFVVVILGEKWDYAATLLIPICFNMMWYPIHSINLNLLQVKGRSDLFLKLEIIKKVIGVLFIVCSVPFGLLVMCYAGILQSFVSLAINTYYSGKLIGVGFFVQLKDTLPCLILSFSMFIVSFVSSSFCVLAWQNLIVGIVVGSVLFMIVSLLICKDELLAVKSMLLRKK